MNINSLNCSIKSNNVYRKNFNSQKKSSQMPLNASGFTSSNILAQYNKAAVNFGQKFDATNLQDEKSNDVFSIDELLCETGKFDIQSAIELAYQTTKEQIAHLEKYGELIHYKQREYREECRNMGLDEEETKKYIEQKTNDFKERISRQKQDVIDVIDKFSPTKKEHCVYRIDTLGYLPYQIDYFEKLASSKEGDIISLGQTPIYTSTSEKIVYNTYGHKSNNPNNGALLKIILPAGSKLIKMPSNDGIQQCIMKPDSQFEVVEHSEFDDNFHYITLKYLP